MAAKIKLKRLGKIRNPQYRIVVADARNKRDGRAIEELGLYHPKEEPSFIKVDSERVQYWLSVGAQPTDAVRAILRVTGDWQKFKGGPVGIETIAAAVGEDKETLEDVYEPYLVQQGFVARTRRGREITELGLAQVGLDKRPSALRELNR